MKKILIEGKNIFVSGANRGIGKAITIELLEKGAKKVYGGARNLDSLSELKERYGDRLVPVELDVTNGESVSKASNIASDVEILINNAGILIPGNFKSGNMSETLGQNFEVNLWGLVKVTEAFLPILQKQEEAAIVSISSMAGIGNMPMLGSYSVSKAAVHSVIQDLRGELKASNILVAGVYPGPIATDMTKSFEGMMEMSTPESTAKNIVQAVEDGTEDIFPDPMSQVNGTAYLADPKAVETQFANYA